MQYKAVLAPNTGTMGKPARRFRMKQGAGGVGFHHLVASNDPAQNMQMLAQFAEQQAWGAFVEDFEELWVLDVDMNTAQLTEFENGDECKMPATTTAKTTTAKPKTAPAKRTTAKTTRPTKTSVSATKMTSTETIPSDTTATETSTSTKVGEK